MLLGKLANAALGRVQCQPTPAAAAAAARFVLQTDGIFVLWLLLCTVAI
jgi:hypothetical protein